MLRNRSLLVVAIIGLTPIGCSQLPAPPAKPSLDPSASAEQAIESYDADSSATIDMEEAKASPGLVNAFARIDTNADQVLDAEEIAERIRYYKNAATTIISGSVEIRVAGRPLEGATVTFEPEEFLGDSFIDCVGVTSARGVASLKGPDAQFPGIYLGVYRVKVSKQVGGKEMVPAKYNTETTLGYEAADDLQDVSNGIVFNLTK